MNNDNVQGISGIHTHKSFLKALKIKLSALNAQKDDSVIYIYLIYVSCEDGYYKRRNDFYCHKCSCSMDGTLQKSQLCDKTSGQVNNKESGLFGRHKLYFESFLCI